MLEDRIEHDMAVIESSLGKVSDSGYYLYFPYDMQGKPDKQAVKAFLNGSVRKFIFQGMSDFEYKTSTKRVQNIVTGTQFTPKKAALIPLETIIHLGYYNSNYVNKKCLQVMHNNIKNTLGPNNSKNIEGSKIMSKINFNTDKVIDANVSAAKQAAMLTTGKTLNRVVRDKLTPQLPLMVRGYANTQIGEVVIANIVSFVVSNFAANNPKARLAAESMMAAAMYELVNSFNIDEMISDVLSEVSIESLTTAADSSS